MAFSTGCLILSGLTRSAKQSGTMVEKIHAYGVVPVISSLLPFAAHEFGIRIDQVVHIVHDFHHFIYHSNLLLSFELCDVV